MRRGRKRKGEKPQTTYATPHWFVDHAAERLGLSAFALDLAAQRETSKAIHYLGPDHENPAWRDAFSFYTGAAPRGLGNAAWLNPPYTDLVEWMILAGRFAESGWTVVGLLPGLSRDTDWWLDGVYGFGRGRVAHSIHDVYGRIKFELHGVTKTSPDFNNVVVVWRPGPQPFLPSTGVPLCASADREVEISTRRIAKTARRKF